MRCVVDIEMKHEDFIARMMNVFPDKICTCRVINESNDSQFHNDESKNVLTAEEIETHDRLCSKE